MKAGEQAAQLTLIWPLATPDALFPEASEQEAPAEEAAAAEAPATEEASPAPVGGVNHIRTVDFSSLPGYSRSLLKIRVPVRVVLASRKESLQDIVELAPGTIVKFDKACDELLHLHVGDQPAAEGEAVKVGDKFGFRVLAMLLPEEHFLKVERTKAS